MARQMDDALAAVKEQSAKLLSDVREMSRSGALAVGVRGTQGRIALLGHLAGLKSDSAALAAAGRDREAAAELIEEALGEHARDAAAYMIGEALRNDPDQ